MMGGNEAPQAWLYQLGEGMVRRAREARQYVDAYYAATGVTADDAQLLPTVGMTYMQILQWLPEEEAVQAVADVAERLPRSQSGHVTFAARARAAALLKAARYLCRLQSGSLVEAELRRRGHVALAPWDGHEVPFVVTTVTGSGT